MLNDYSNLNIKLLAPTFEPWVKGQSDRQIAVLISGGVDSSVTASLLKEAGWKVLGITMKVPLADHCKGQAICCGAEAGYVAGQLGIAHYFVDVSEAFERLIIEPFRTAYHQGRTPNPCVDCNTRLKFDLVWRLLEDRFGIRHLATGHYARVVNEAGQVRLTRPVDRDKDQSYFLYGISRDRLDRLVLPLGDLTKDQVRELARERQLAAAERAESMELCFAGEGDYRRALAGTVEPYPGPILDTAGNEIGRHEGITNYTIGQRKGLKVAAGKPLYVLSIDPGRNSVTLGTQDQVSRREVAAERVNVLLGDQLYPGAQLFGKIRSSGEPAGCTVVRVSEQIIAVRFDEPKFAPTAGQHLVLYDEPGQIVAGGVICEEASQVKGLVKTDTQCVIPLLEK